MAVGVEICERIKHTTEPNKPLCIKFELQINRREKRKQQQLVNDFKTFFTQNGSTTSRLKRLIKNKHQIYTQRERTMNIYKLTACIWQLELKYVRKRKAKTAGQ